MKLFLNVAFVIKYATHLLLPTTANIFIDFLMQLDSKTDLAVTLSPVLSGTAL